MPKANDVRDPEESLCFGPFRIEVAAKQVWCGAEKLAIRPLPVKVLTYFVRRPGRVVRTEELLQALWTGTRVSRLVIRVCIREIRRALGDDAAAPRYIETIGKQGYRFIAPIAPLSVTTPPVISGQPLVVSSDTEQTQLPQLATVNRRLALTLVGREEELSQLQAWFATAGSGQRQLVFVAGEVGIGKTTLVDHFLDRIQTQEAVWIGQGQCIEHYGAGEAYLPVLDALGRMGQGPGHDSLLQVLRRIAPSWLGQLPALVAEGELEALQRKVQGVPRERMLREFADACVGLKRRYEMKRHARHCGRAAGDPESRSARFCFHASTPYYDRLRRTSREKFRLTAF